MSFDAPGFLVLWPLVVAVLLGRAWYWRSPWRRVAWPSVMLLPLILALGEPWLVGFQGQRQVIVIVDTSGSFLARATPEQIAARVAVEIRSLRRGDSLLVITAAASPRVVLETTVGDVPPVLSASLFRPVADATVGTDLAAALDMALQRLLPTPTAIFLLTDARHTGRHEALEAAILRAKALGIPIRVDSLGPSQLPNVALVGGDMPPVVDVGVPFFLRAFVRTTHPAIVEFTVTRQDFAMPGVLLRLTRNSQPLTPLTGSAVPRFLIQPGATYTLTAEVPGEAAPGTVRFGVQLHVHEGANAVLADDRVNLALVVGQIALTVVTPDGAETTFTRWLAQSRPQWRVQRLAPSVVPLDAAGWLNTRCIVFDSVPREVFGNHFDAVDHAVSRAVENLGAGFIMLGGRGAFGPGGYVGTRIDRVLPVDCDPNREVRAEVLIVLDSSASMTGDKLRQAAQATAALLSRLSPKDQVALMSFDRWPRFAALPGSHGRFVPATPDLLAGIAQTVSSLETRGETNVFAALELAVREFVQRPVTDAVRLIVLLSDGEPTAGLTTFTDEFAALLRQAAAANIMIGVISTEPIVTDSNTLFVAMQAWFAANNPTGNSVKEVGDLSQLPREFEERLATARGPLLQERHADGFTLEAKGVATPSRILQYARTAAKRDGGTVNTVGWYQVPDRFRGAPREPAVAWWRVGAGAAAAIMLPLGDTECLGERWESQALWETVAQAVDAVTHGEPPTWWNVSVEDRPDGVFVVVMLADDLPASRRADWLETAGWLFWGDTSRGVVQLPLRPVTPSRLEAHVPDELAHDRVLTGAVFAPTGERMAVALPLPQHREWQNLSLDGSWLSRLNSLPDESLAVWLNRQAAKDMGRIRLMPWLALLAVVLLVADAAWRVRKR